MISTETPETPAAQSFEIAIQLLSPICLAAAVPAGNLTSTLDYIPGSTVRGALAALYLASGKPADATFERLFLSGEVTYGNLYLNGSAPAPLSARSCKHEPGFTRDDTGHGVVDWLLPSFAQRLAKRAKQEACTAKWVVALVMHRLSNSPTSTCR
jgi:CRISPR-associated protein Csx10